MYLKDTNDDWAYDPDEHERNKEWWESYKKERNVATEKQDFEQARDEAVADNAQSDISSPLGEFIFHQGTKKEFKVSEKQDVTNAFNLLWSTFENDVAVEVAEYYADQFFLDPQLDSFGATKPTGLFGGAHRTKINLKLIYKSMDETLPEHKLGFPEIDETDQHQRAVFISCILFHEYLHTMHGSLPSAGRIKAEAAIWAATYWYIHYVGGHAWLKKHAYRLVSKKGCVRRRLPIL